MCWKKLCCGHRDGGEIGERGAEELRARIDRPWKRHRQVTMTDVQAAGPEALEDLEKLFVETRKKPLEGFVRIFNSPRARLQSREAQGGVGRAVQTLADEEVMASHAAGRPPAA